MGLYGRTPEDLPVSRKNVVPVASNTFNLYSGPVVFNLSETLAEEGADGLYAELNIQPSDTHNVSPMSGYWVFGANIFASGVLEPGYEFGFKLSEYGLETTDIITVDIEPFVSSTNLYVEKTIEVPYGKYVYLYVDYFGTGFDAINADITGWGYPILF